MKPDWDKLMKKFKKDATRLIADVDCTAKGQALCETHGVRGYPTIKHGDPNALEDYQGGRSYKDMKKFAEGLTPKCSPFNMDLCDDDEKAKINDMKALGVDKLKENIKEEEKKIEEAEQTFKDEVDKLQKQYQDLSNAKDEAIKAVKDSGLGLMKSVLASLGSAGKEEL